MFAGLKPGFITTSSPSSGNTKKGSTKVSDLSSLAPKAKNQKKMTIHLLPAKCKNNKERTIHTNLDGPDNISNRQKEEETTRTMCELEAHIFEEALMECKTSLKEADASAINQYKKNKKASCSSSSSQEINPTAAVDSAHSEELRLQIFLNRARLVETPTFRNAMKEIDARVRDESHDTTTAARFEALGCRSILAPPDDPKTRNVVLVKFDSLESLVALALATVKEEYGVRDFYSPAEDGHIPVLVRYAIKHLKQLMRVVMKSLHKQYLVKTGIDIHTMLVPCSRHPNLHLRICDLRTRDHYMNEDVHHDVKGVDDLLPTRKTTAPTTTTIAAAVITTTKNHTQYILVSNHCVASHLALPVTTLCADVCRIIKDYVVDGDDSCFPLANFSQYPIKSWVTEKDVRMCHILAVDISIDTENNVIDCSSMIESIYKLLELSENTANTKNWRYTVEALRRPSAAKTEALDVKNMVEYQGCRFLTPKGMLAISQWFEEINRDVWGDENKKLSRLAMFLRIVAKQQLLVMSLDIAANLQYRIDMGDVIGGM